jgi:ABC-type dipeptide/oligopeptide/nickel transport system permease subunit
MTISPARLEAPPQRQTLRRFLRPWPTRLGLAIVAALVFSALLADFIAPFGPTEGNLDAARIPPLWHAEGQAPHLLGTDQLGQDVFSRLLYGARVSLLVSFFGVAIASGLGLLAGMAAGYLGGWVDGVISASVNLVLSVPYLVLVIVIATVFGRSLLNVILIFGFTNAPIFIRLVRAEVMRLRQQEFILSAESLGAPRSRILVRHVLPNLLGPLITLAIFEMTAMIFYEAGLSFIGLSVPPEVPSWGNMLQLGRRLLPIHPWISLAPALAIALMALGINLVGDAVRRALDPRQR